MKTKEELNALRNEVKNLNKKLAELTDEELAEVFGGLFPPFREKPKPDAIESVLRWDSFDVYQNEKSL